MSSICTLISSERDTRPHDLPFKAYFFQQLPSSGLAYTATGKKFSSFPSIYKKESTTRLKLCAKSVKSELEYVLMRNV